MTPDRRVHAIFNHPDGPMFSWELVRYDKAGKWYQEYGDGARVHIGINEAARLAREYALPHGSVFPGLPGGKAFDQKVGA